METHIKIPTDQLAKFCKRWEIAELSLFGSVLREDFKADSDVDIMVRFSPDARHTFLDIVQIQEDLSGLLGREVDLVERSAIEKSRNYIRRKSILQSAEVIYAT